jgi:hypothetical protein
MTTTEAHPYTPTTEQMSDRHEIRVAAGIISAGSSVEAVGGIAGVALAIIALAGILPTYLAPIAAIALGAALLAEGSAIASRLHALLAQTTDSLESTEVGGGISAEFLGGGAAVILGLLALLGVEPVVLLAVALLVFAGTLVIGAGAQHELNALAIQNSHHSSAGRAVARESMRTATGAQVLVGLAAGALGIIALVGIQPTTLILVGLLSVGAASVLSGTAVTGRLLSSLRRS